MFNNSYLPKMASRLAGYKTQCYIGFPRTKPLSLTVSITQKCNSKCKTCNIWKDTRSEKGPELSLDEYEAILKSVGQSVVWYTLSGGEPFLRKDIVDIAKLIKKYSNPKVINIPTNAILANRIINDTEQILQALSPGTTLIVNLSLDGIGEAHDEIRGIPGNFKTFLKTYTGLKELKNRFPDSFELGVHSVVSRFNVASLLDLYDYVKQNLQPDSYICEIAENREELLNTDDDITPPVARYEETIRPLQREIKESLLRNEGITGLMQAFRLKYYDYVILEMRKNRRIIPCYAGQVSAQISPWGDVWPCCILAYKADMGNLREYDLDFNKLWYAPKAMKVRKQVRHGDCYCPMANVHYTNMALTPSSVVGVMSNYLGARLARK